MVGLILWFIMVGFVILVWLSRFITMHKRLCIIDGTLQRSVVALSAILLILLNMWLGISGGFVAMQGAIGLFQLPSWWQDF